VSPRPLDISSLSALIATPKKNDRVGFKCCIYSVAWPKIDAKFVESLPQRFAVAIVPEGNAIKARSNDTSSSLVAKPPKPV